jgi:hypothetical protein
MGKQNILIKFSHIFNGALGLTDDELFLCAKMPRNLSGTGGGGQRRSGYLWQSQNSSPGCPKYSYCILYV